MTETFTDLDNISGELYVVKQLSHVKNDIYSNLYSYLHKFNNASNGDEKRGCVMDLIHELNRVYPQLTSINNIQIEKIQNVTTDIDTRYDELRKKYDEDSEEAKSIAEAN